MSDQYHWEQVYKSKLSDAVSWYQPHADTSLALVNTLGIDKAVQIIDVGGGASTLVDDLIAQGFSQLTVLDLSTSALDTARARLGDYACKVDWLTADITQIELPKDKYQLWHDRAVFHFLTTEIERAAYKKNLVSSLKPGGFIIIATFAEDGPLKCSNLPVMRYSTEQLYDEFSSDFILLDSRKEVHRTPFDTTQSFIYCLMQRR